MDPTEQTLTLVANPSAGRGRAGRLLPKIAAELYARMPHTEVRVVRSTGFDDAQHQMRRAVAEARPAGPGGVSPDTLVVMGGDGMAHLGVNACAGTDVALGIIPAGTGNDFCRGTGVPLDIFGATTAIAERHVVQTDLAHVAWGEGANAEQRWVGCTVSSGYDAVVSQAVREFKLPLGSLNYALVALRELARFSPIDYEIAIDGDFRRSPGMFVAISNSSYFGGAMKIAPGADIHDGLLEVTFVHPVSRGTLLRLLPRIYSGGHVHHPAVEVVRAKQVVIGGFTASGEGDGELLGPAPLTVTAVQDALNLIAARPEPKELTRG